MGGKLWLWGVEYKREKTILSFYDDETNRFIFLEDPYGHKPNFLVEARNGVGETVRRLLQNGETVQLVELEDLLKGQERKFLRVFVNNPLRVRELRDELRQAGFKTYEDDIRYIRRYLIDTALIPWMPYRLVSGIPVPAFDVESEEAVYETAIPIPRYAAFDIEVMPTEKTAMPNPETDPIISVSIVTSDGKKILLMLKDYAPRQKPAKLIGWELKVFERESELILELHRILRKYPVVLGYNVEGFDIPYLVERAEALGIAEALRRNRSFWYSRGKRLKFGNEMMEWEPDWGRLIDLFQVYTNDSIRLYTYGNAYQSSRLEDVAEALLGRGKEFGGEKKVWEMTPEELAVYNAVDSELVAELFSQNNHLIWRILVLLARISGLGIDELWRTTISSWIEQLLNRKHVDNGWLIPDREELRKKGGEGKYEGAIVLEPKPGLYRNVYVLDFASLYPTNIVKWNLSYETVNPSWPCDELKPIPNTPHKVCMDVPGAVASTVEGLREHRLQYKRKAKDSSLSDEERQFYDAVQMTLKVFINASYGVLGNKDFRYFYRPAAESTTALGRWAITKAKKIAEEEFGWTILYGDTDSIFVWKMNKEISEDEIQRFIKRIEDELGYEIELDKVFDVLLLIKKKMYIGKTKEGKIVIKGIKAKKGDAPPVVRKYVQKIIEAVVAGKGKETAIKEAEEVLAEAFREIEQAPIEDLAMSMAFDKDPSEYKSPSSRAAKVITAYWLVHGHLPLPKERIPYVKTKTPIKFYIVSGEKHRVEKIGRDSVRIIWSSGEFVPVGDKKPAKKVESGWLPISVVKELGLEELVDRSKAKEELESAAGQILEALGTNVKAVAKKAKTFKSLMDFLGKKA